MDIKNKHVQFFLTSKRSNAEVLVDWLDGYVGEMMGSKEKSQHNGALVLTDQRCCFVRKGFFGEMFEAIPNEKISSIETRSLMGHRSISVHTSHDDLTFKTFENKERFGSFVEALEKQKAVTHSGSAHSLTSSDPLADLERLGQLRDAGVLTDEEFAQKKAELLSRL